MRAVLVGILSSLFFSATFIINRAMNLGGTSWAWTASLRFILALPFLFLIVLFRKNLGNLIREMAKHPFQWLLWGTAGGVGFYSLLSFAAIYGPSWLTSGTWQVTILAGALLSPLFFVTLQTDMGLTRVRQAIPFKSLRFSFIILIGVILMQVNQAGHISAQAFLLGFIPVVIGAFLYPLGNRKMMELCQGRIDTFQRTLGMAISSLPVAIILGIYGTATVGLPTGSQFVQALLLALFSGVIASILFFLATDMAKNNMGLLAAVESTQSGTMIFTVLGEVILLNGSFPRGLSLLGMIVVIIGMILTSLANGKQKKLVKLRREKKLFE
ncbi:multidrug resistance efflux transporter family protein [Brevibacillus laterosporus]|uniref:Multidrug resistance efflux transporter family protein n=1 Tax=Brevibacillus laterosporus TaxID=1465 RepID=A0AAP8U339_BRELA|nr:multidrug resistance efflux transporter family protein [Brevibacillus laterosporus]MBG9796679.1 membrane protein [Brevibacillus laterosporus]MCR8935748.1 multidrug resistance efflux transporter family protein [Brevibacillus laterosporus]MCR8980779.1 multidrug resistance efflux transporter family protein [Brevibacillus laterosporus]MCZ0807934.1 multidrug resistance efflux transporter family protein [Brevibacillus laterosporus]MCZ0826175.1 multidrug resistance efflux transporter family protei